VFLPFVEWVCNNSYSQKAYEMANYNGQIGNNSIVLELIQGDAWMGSYYYTKQNKKINFSSDKMVYEEGGQIKLKESVNEKFTGYFIFNSIDLEKSTLNGKWFTPDGKQSYDVKLTKTKKEIEADYSGKNAANIAKELEKDQQNQDYASQMDALMNQAPSPLDNNTRIIVPNVKCSFIPKFSTMPVMNQFCGDMANIEKANFYCYYAFYKDAKTFTDEKYMLSFNYYKPVCKSDDEYAIKYYDYISEVMKSNGYSNSEEVTLSNLPFIKYFKTSEKNFDTKKNYAEFMYIVGSRNREIYTIFFKVNQYDHSYLAQYTKTITDIVNTFQYEK
jgi:hypothetical protein